MEMHLVHKKTDYASVGASLDYNDGLAVIGIMFQVADTSDDGLTVRATMRMNLQKLFIFCIYSLNFSLELFIMIFFVTNNKY